jgi:hypothetical protein
VSWEDVERSFDRTRPEDILVTLGLERLGELVGRVASEYARIAGLPQFDPHTELAQHLVVDAWRYCCHMADRAEFAKSVTADLENLDAEAPQSSTPDHLPFGHLPEFGGAAPLPHAPKELERRLEPPV